MKKQNNYTLEELGTLKDILNTSVSNKGKWTTKDVVNWLDIIKNQEIITAPYDQLPLYINHKEIGITIIAQWRLRIGK